MRQNIKYPKITVKHTAQNWRLSCQCPQVELKIFLERKDREEGIFFIISVATSGTGKKARSEGL